MDKKTSSALPLICVGHSNGAATLIATLSQYPELAQDIQGLLLVAPYADIALLQHPQKYVPQWLPYRRPIARRLMSYAICPNHDVNARTPAQWIEEGHFPRNIPTLLIHAEDDIQVPYINFELLSTAFESYRNVRTTSVKTGGHWIGRCEPHNICKKCHPCIHGLKAWQYCEECSKGPEKPCCTNNNHPNYCSRRNCKAEQMSRSQLDTNLRIFFDTILK